MQKLSSTRTRSSAPAPPSSSEPRSPVGSPGERAGGSRGQRSGEGGGGRKRPQGAAGSLRKEGTARAPRAATGASGGAHGPPRHARSPAQTHAGVRSAPAPRPPLAEAGPPPREPDAARCHSPSSSRPPCRCLASGRPVTGTQG